MSTRKLIIAALICGIVILLAGAVQFVQIARDRASSSSVPASSVTTLSGH